MQFLKYVAEDIRKRFKNDLSRVAMVFPNRRSGVFFDDYLLKQDEVEPVWAPQYLTIGDLFDNLATQNCADEIKSVCLLYQIYKEQLETIPNHDPHANEVSLDYFYGWGEQLLNDFSDIDRSMIDARELFSSWSAARQLEKMSDEERETLRPFLETLHSSGRMKDDFENLWGRLFVIYQKLNEALAADGEAYEGMRQRRVVEELKSGAIQLSDRFDAYAFVGFNKLVPVEWQFLDYVQEQGKALFYWDYDRMYVGENVPLSFGKTLQENLAHFPNALNADYFDNLAHKKELEFVSASSDYAQTTYMTTWLQQHLTRENERDTAVVLCDETLLQPVVYNIPNDVNEVNITKGFPMSHTPAFADVSRFFDSLNTDATAEDTINAQILDKLSASLQETAQREMQRHGEQTWLGQLTAESYFQCFTTVNRFKTFVDDTILDVSRRSLRALLCQILSGLSIPFHGEPASGLQVMGVLETRNLDFKHILLLSVGEGIVPRVAADRSFVPYDLRKHYRIMTSDERSEVYAYNFFRLLQRAEYTTIVYNESTDGEKNRGEMSRFLLQILALTRIPVKCFSLKEQGKSSQWTLSSLDEETSRQLMENRALKLSPTALAQYISCPMKYFFSHVASLKELPVLSDLLPNNTFGSIFHRAAELIYRDLRDMNSYSLSVALNALVGNIVQLDKYIAQAFVDISEEDLQHNSLLGEQSKGESVYQMSEHEVEASVVREYLQRLLKFDAQMATHCALSVIGTEEKLDARLDDLTQIAGTIDRVDSLQINGALEVRVVDYKTGHYDEKKMQAPNLERLFEKVDTQYVLQTLFYELLYQMNHQIFPVPALYYTQKVGGEDFDPYVHIGSAKDGLDLVPRAEKVAQFKELLVQYIQQMRTSAFTCTQDAMNCKYCSFRLLCGRN